MAKKLGDMLIDHGVITKEQLLEGLKHQAAHGVMLGEALIATSAISDESVITHFLSQQLNLGTLALKDMEFDPDVVDLVPYDIAQRYTIIPINKTKRVLTVAISDPKNIFMLDAIKFLTGFTVQPVLASAKDIRDAINTNYRNENAITDILKEVGSSGNIEVVKEESHNEPEDIGLRGGTDAPVVKLVNHILTEAVRKGASDIHIESYQNILRVRYRIDGMLIEVPPLPYNLRMSVVSRIKIMANLDISERRLPQDGRVKVNIGGKVVDIRVSTIPAIFGEKVVMRILDSSNLMLDMSAFGIAPESLTRIREAFNASYGMILVTGPTGSGKSTTLYSALSSLNKPDVNIMTAEDPVEYNIDGINQINVHPAIGLTFAAALRSFLRQDPDIVMVGEIRDYETAEIAVKAALTGHLVLSTLHTNDSASTLTRLTDMGVDAFLCASAVRLIIAQRLIRLICPNCKTRADNTGELVDFLKIPAEELQNITFYKGAGCPACNNTGYKGRAGLYEVLPITPKIQDLVIAKKPPYMIKKAAEEAGMISLKMAGLEKLKAGVTTIEEILGATS